MDDGWRTTVLVLTSTYPRWKGDPEPGFVHELSKRLTSRFRVIVLCPHAPGAAVREMLDGVEIVRYRYAPTRMELLVNNGGIVTNLKNHRWKLLLVPAFVLAQGWCAWRLCRSEKVSMIHAHWLLPQGLMAVLLAGLSGRSLPFVVTSHGADLYALKGRWLDSLKRFVARHATAVTVVSSAMRDRLVLLGVPLERIRVLPMGVDLGGRFTPDPEMRRSRAEILFVGRLVEKKGLRHLLNALPLVQEHVPEAHLTIVGFGPDEAALRAQAELLGLGQSVHFVGAVPQAELPAYYRRAALFVGPFVQAASGDQEGLPVALMEAVACGCPAVAGDVAGMEDLLGKLKPDVCVDVRDTKALAAKVCKMLAEPDRAQAMSEKILGIVSAHIDWARISAEYGAILGSIR